MTGAGGMTLVYTRVFRLYGLYTQLKSDLIVDVADWLYPYDTCRIGLENWSSKSSAASNPLHPTNQIDRIHSNPKTAPPRSSRINPVQEDH